MILKIGDISSQLKKDKSFVNFGNCVFKLNKKDKLWIEKMLKIHHMYFMNCIFVTGLKDKESEA
jgi:hypothetical protein